MTRSLAAGVDVAMVIVLCSIAYAVVAGARLVFAPTMFEWPEPSFWFSVGFAMVVAVVYLTAAWATTGRSYGDSLLGLRVLTNRRRRLGWPHAFARAALCVVFPIGLALVVVNDDRRSIQDILMRTVVVYDWHVSE